ncbi:MAG: B12-binding domain-containing radical SAM protein [Bacillota bacterium]
MRIRLIAPANRRANAPKQGLFPPMSLAILAALTPDKHEVEVVDESVQDHVMEPLPDLVGITAITSVAPRAYELADEYRRQGVRVVMGGMHPSALPEEAVAHADSVVVGEAEGVWEDVLKDAASGRMRPIYRNERLPSLCGLPAPRWDAFDPRKYLTLNLVQTSRGCPNNCSFCSVTRFFGKTYRTRPVREVVEEVSMLGRRLVLFVDDNIAGNRAHARELFRELRPMKISWLGQSSLAIAEDQSLLDAARESGCAGLFIGFESLVSENLERIGKAMVNRVDRFLESIKRIHSRGISIEGAFIFGLDGDDGTVFAKTVEFATKARLALAQFGILTPFPGTPLFSDLESNNRIIDRDWGNYTISNVVFRPENLSPAALREGFLKAYRRFYSPVSIARRLLPAWRRQPLLFLILNMHFARIAHSMQGLAPSPGSTVS